MKIKESQLRQIIKESLKELDWKTYANAAKKAQQWRDENPFKYDRNRGMHFDSAAQKRFNQQHDIENLPDYGGEKGNINFTSFHGEPEISGSRNHDFGDGGGPFNLSHTVYHMGKQYGKDGGYGRTRMWDHPHETTPEEFFDSDEMGKKFRDAEQDVDDFKNGNYNYTPDKGWHLKESRLNKIIKESIKKCLNEAEGYVWYGDKSLVQAVANDANQVRIMAEQKITDEPDTNIYHELHDWANKVMNEADEFLQYHSDNVSIMSEAHDIDDDTYYGGGLPDSYHQDPAHEQPNEYDNDEPSIPEDISNFIYEKIKDFPEKIYELDAESLSRLDNRFTYDVYWALCNENIEQSTAAKYVREYIKCYLPTYKTAYNKLRHVVEDAGWLFNETI